MADLVRAEDLPVGTRVQDGAMILIKVDESEWTSRDGWEGDRQVNIRLDTGATVLPRPSRRKPVA